MRNGLSKNGSIINKETFYFLKKNNKFKLLIFGSFIKKYSTNPLRQFLTSKIHLINIHEINEIFSVLFWVLK